MPTTKTPGKADFSIRIDVDLRDTLLAKAREADRSIGREISRRLRQSLEREEQHEASAA